MSTNVEGVVGVNETCTCDAFSCVTLWVKSVAAAADPPQAMTTSKLSDAASASLAKAPGRRRLRGTG
jgi:hypothetical protein